MKKLSILVALILCVTIGGVYAAWVYFDTNDVVDQHSEVVVELESAQVSGAIGTYTINTNLKLKIDQVDGSDHVAELEYYTADSSPAFLTVTFTPAPGAPKDVKDNGLQSYLKIATTTTMQYPADGDGKYDTSGTLKDIFVITPSTNINTSAWTKSGDTFTKTFDEAALKELVKLNGPIILDTKASYTAFGGLLSGNIKFTISDGNVA